MIEKQYEELKFTDDFMFCKILNNNKDICKEIIELLIGCKAQVAFLEYVAGKEPTDDLTRRLNSEVSRAQRKEEWRSEYMTLLQRDREKYAEGRAEGIVLITDAFKRLVAGENKESLVNSGVPEDIVNEAEALLKETINK